MKNYSIRIPEHYMELIRREAEITGESVSEVIRGLIEESLRIS